MKTPLSFWNYKTITLLRLKILYVEKNKNKNKERLFIPNTIPLSSPHRNKTQINGLISTTKSYWNGGKIIHNEKEFKYYLKIFPCYTFRAHNTSGIMHVPSKFKLKLLLAIIMIDRYIYIYTYKHAYILIHIHVYLNKCIYNFTWLA